VYDLSEPRYGLWLIWGLLPFLHKLFFLVLFIVAVYSLLSATKVLWRIRSLMASRHSKDAAALQCELATLSARSANSRRLITATFYLFGILFFWGLHYTLLTTDSKVSVGFLILENFFLYFAFAVNVFFVFLALHLVQWLASARLQACARALANSPIA
jgi:hypothetical protein